MENRPTNWLDAFEADIQATIDRDAIVVNGRDNTKRADGLRLALKHFRDLRKESEGFKSSDVPRDPG